MAFWVLAEMTLSLRHSGTKEDSKNFLVGRVITSLLEKQPVFRLVSACT